MPGFVPQSSLLGGVVGRAFTGRILCNGLTILENRLFRAAFAALKSISLGSAGKLVRESIRSAGFRDGERFKRPWLPRFRGYDLAPGSP